LLLAREDGYRRQANPRWTDKSVTADNLYVGRAKELLQSQETQAKPQSASGNGDRDPLRIAPKDPYRTEH
jgi:hypothetical protein